MHPYSALYDACRRGCVSTVGLLLELKTNIEEPTRRGNRPLHVAAWRGHTAVVKMLLEHRAHCNAQNEDGETPLHLAVRRRDFATARALGSVADVNTQDEFGRTPLHAACGEPENMDCIRELLFRGADPDYTDQSGYKPIHIAAHKGCVSNIRALLVYSGMCPNSLTGTYETALHIAAHFNHVHILKELVNSGADAQATDDSGKTPLIVAVNETNDEAVAYLLEAGVDPEMADIEGRTPLHYAAWRGSVSCVSQLQEAGASAKKTDHFQRTPVHMAAMRGHVSALRRLLKTSDPNTQDGAGRTALHYAVRSRITDLSTACTAELIRSGASLDIADIESRTPLSYARLNPAALLLAFGARPIVHTRDILEAAHAAALQRVSALSDGAVEASCQRALERFRAAARNPECPFALARATRSVPNDQGDAFTQETERFAYASVRRSLLERAHAEAWTRAIRLLRAKSYVGAAVVARAYELAEEMVTFVPDLEEKRRRAAETERTMRAFLFQR